MEMAIWKNRRTVSVNLTRIDDFCVRGYVRHDNLPRIFTLASKPQTKERGRVVSVRDKVCKLGFAVSRARLC